MQILKALIYSIIVLGILLGGIFAIGIFNFHGQQPSPENAFRNQEPNRAAFYLMSIQGELQRIADAAALFKK